MSDEGEVCQRCGEVGYDRRTLWMACFYAMSELGMPFTEYSVNGQVCEKIGEKPVSEAFPNLKAAVWSEPTGESWQHQFYTLRVCKECRGSWMSAIQSWFRRPPVADQRCGSGIFIRDNGATREITREEWDRRNSG